jgi:hypothetical protein
MIGMRVAWLALAALLFAAVPGRAASVGLCGCCLEKLPEACASACAAMSLPAGQCPAFAIFGAAGALGPDGNPLTAMSLKEITLGEASRGELERFRRFVERARRKAIRDWKRAARRFERGRLAEAEFKEKDRLYREALVNYYHAIRAYRAAARGTP